MGDIICMSSQMPMDIMWLTMIRWETDIDIFHGERCIICDGELLICQEFRLLMTIKYEVEGAKSIRVEI